MLRLRHLPWTAAVVSLLLALLPIMAIGKQATPAAVADMQYTPLIPSVPSPPRWFTGSDGRVHLVYELFLTNGFPVPVTVTGVDVLADEADQPLASLDGDALTAVMSLLSEPTTPTTVLAPSTVGVVWLDISLPDVAAVPASVSHRITMTIPPGLPVPETMTYDGASAEVDRRPPAVLGPPLTGPGWAAIGSCCDGPHRRAFQPLNGGLYLSQRFAIDFNRLDAEDRLATGNLSLNESYPSFGETVVAVTDATVIAAVDRYPDQIPNDPRDVTLENADGNHVVLDLGDGRYAFYAHLKAGSVTVEEGETVRQGQPIGELGNSGSSSGPHLHFHVMNGPSPLQADGLPYVFDHFDLSGRMPPLDQTIALAESQQPIPLDRAGAGPHRDELPLGRDVVDFATSQ